MKLVRYGIAIGLLAGLGACSNMMGNKGGEAHSAAMTQPTVAPALVKQVQSKLRADGYYKEGNVDGVWGAGTEAAVRSYQHDHNLTANGQLDAPTLQALNLPSGSTNNTNNPGMNNGNTNNPNMNNPNMNNNGMNNPNTNNPNTNNNGAMNNPAPDNTGPNTGPTQPMHTNSPPH